VTEVEKEEVDEEKGVVEDLKWVEESVTVGMVKDVLVLAVEESDMEYGGA